MDLMFEKKCAEDKIVKKCGEGFLKTVSNYAQGIELNECKTDDIKKLAEENDVKTEYSDFSSDVVRYLVAKRFIDMCERKKMFEDGFCSPAPIIKSKWF